MKNVNKFALFCLLIMCLVFVKIDFTQEISVTRQSNKSDNPQTNELVYSKALCVEIVESTLLDNELSVKIKNNCGKLILAAAIRERGASQFYPNFRLEAETERVEKIGVGGYMSEKGFLIEAVLFEDGSGDGEEERMLALQSTFSKQILELRNVLSVISEVEGMNLQTGKKVIFELKSKLESMKDDLSRRKFGGMAFISGKGNVLSNINKFIGDNQKPSLALSTSALAAWKAMLEAEIARYPRVIEEM